MTETPSTAQWLDDRRADLPPFERAVALASAADARADAADLRDELERQAAASDRVEALQLGNRQGDPLGQLRRMREECTQADDLVRDLADRLAKATARRARISETIGGLERQVDEITASVSRSAPSQDLLAEAKRALAADRVERMLAAAQARPPERRPFNGRGAVDAECSGPGCPVCAEGRRRDAARSREAEHGEITRVVTADRGNVAWGPG